MYKRQAVYRVREVALGRGTKLSAEDGFLQYMMERLFASTMPEDEPDLDDYEEEGDSMKLTSIPVSYTHLDVYKRQR